MVGYHAWSSAEARHLSIGKKALNSEVRRTDAWHLAGMRASYEMTRQAGGMGKGWMGARKVCGQLAWPGRHVLGTPLPCPGFL
ncbi:hypothetical protein HAX54_025256 [Datura stramonium]|uniref:Uncharacterized protein n=1 Tax=Datura stramonium TaxID=4076 RepID=A0ABS8UZ36_DATST|nr:hypothetical protein [Datura stramonium]